MDELEPFHLTKEELDSPLWKKLERHFEQRLDVARQENDYPHDVDMTNRLRGRISAYKEFLDLDPNE